MDRDRVAKTISQNIGTKVRVDKLLYVNLDDNSYLFHGDAEGLGKHSELVHFSRRRATDGKTVFIAVWNSSVSEVKQGVTRVYLHLDRFGVSDE